ncbi:tetratricopeptide repeat protein [Saccharothrix sp. 6-C]|uniref:ATP-binding protein n=1 Tax=Saccharothrix sp. 6-C TaxID=2781735 RepID=UPI001916CF1D|nr:tetratricopeptide repeat protein [Saccharothrix sp. 6-C]QQQ78855.1 tetratricopeptide repeat protein [Saccharothrix sp. 6-C]
MTEVRNTAAGQFDGDVVQIGQLTTTLPEARPTAVAGLPPLAVFVGREAELSRLTAALEPESPDPVLVWSVGGLPGVGKTALAVAAARRAVAAGWFPGGVVMADLRGYDQRVTASAAVASLLGALGVASEHIPPEEADRVRLWRSLLTRRERMLVVADNVSGADQVVPLLPGDPRHRVLITSRHRLAGLDLTRLVDLDVLGVPDAVRMLVEVLRMSDPDDTRAHDLAAGDQVARLCGGLPLAVRVAAALLVADPERSMADLAEALADGRRRLRELHYDDNLAVRAAFDLSYRLLDPDQARVLRLTALDPGPDVALDAVAAIADTDRATAARLVRGLRAAHLVQPGGSAGRWRMHDLIRLYARDEAAGDPERDGAVVRLLDHYLAAVRATTDEHGEVRAGSAEVRAVDAERAKLVPLVDLARATGHASHVIALSTDLIEYFSLYKLWSEWITTHELALEVARRTGDRAGEARLLHGLGVGHGQMLRTDLSARYLREAMSLARRLGDRQLFGRSLNRLGQRFRNTGRLAWAMACHRWAAALFVEAGDQHSYFKALHDMAVVHRRRRDLDQAVALHLECLSLAREHRWPLIEGRVLDHLGIAYREMNRTAEAIECHQRNLRIVEEMADRHGHARTMANLAVTYRVADRPAEAVDCHLEALRTFRDFGAVHAVGSVLKELGITYRVLGRDDEAARCWTEALAIFEALPAASAAPVAERTRQHLAELTAGATTPPAASRRRPAPGPPRPPGTA